MADVVLITFNARYHHASFGLRYLKANLGEMADTCQILEFDLDTRPGDALEMILGHQPRIVGLALYIWNTRQSLELARMLKVLRPGITLIIGGPEASYEQDAQPISSIADYIVCGEADLEMAELCQAILSGQRPPLKIVRPDPPDLNRVAMPYHLYNDQDLQHRTIYVESSRGCPFSCEFCLSSLDIPVRRFPLEPFLAEMQKLLDRGCQQFKFVDRTFNVDITHACAILGFFLQRLSERQIFLHFEMISDRLPEEVRDLLAQFPPGSIQLEIGVQSFNEEVVQRIGRRQDNTKVEANLRFLRERTHAHIHADLIAGLPGESFDSFAAGFDRLHSLHPHEIQLGILKRLRGVPIARHTETFGIIYSPEAPYEIMENALIDFTTMQRLKRMARYWDIFSNSGHFCESLPLIWASGSPFRQFLAFGDFIYQRTGKTHQIALPKQFELLWDYLKHSETAGRALAADYLRPHRRDLPDFLKPFAPASPARESPSPTQPRQLRHMR